METQLKTIKNSKVLLRVCYDLSDFENLDRIVDSIATISELLKQGNQIYILSHWGRPEGFDLSLSNKKILPFLNKILTNNNLPEAVFFDQFEIFKQNKDLNLVFEGLNLSKSPILFLENTRFEKCEQSKELEEKLNLAKKYSLLGDFFVDEAFPVSHRNEATNSGLKSLLPFAYGLAFKKEVEILTKIKNNPDKPFALLMAGSKLETKLVLLDKLAPQADTVILGGKISLVISFACYKMGKIKQLDLGEFSIDDEYLEIAMEVVNKYFEKLVLPVDFSYGNLFGKREVFDIGPKSVELFIQTISKSKTFFWNGTVGYYEKPPFDKGTLEIAKAVSEMDTVFKVLGGGDTNASIPLSVRSKFDFASMGGGATLQFLEQ